MTRLQDRHRQSNLVGPGCRGEFVRGDGLVIPNNVSIAGAMAVLASAFQGVDPTISMGLVYGAPTLTMIQGDAVEPTIGVNGYARQALARGVASWVLVSSAGNEAFIESDWVQFNAITGAFDQQINRVALFNTATYNGSAPILAMSAVITPSVTIDANTRVENRRFKYRFYI